MKTLRLKESCTVYDSATRNRYGDFSLGNGVSVLCLYRNISQLNRGVNFREEVQIQGIFWLDPAASVHQGDIILYNGSLYRIENLVEGKTLLTRNTLHFHKAMVSLYRGIS